MLLASSAVALWRGAEAAGVADAMIEVQKKDLLSIHIQRNIT